MKCPVTCGICEFRKGCRTREIRILRKMLVMAQHDMVVTVHAEKVCKSFDNGEPPILALEKTEGKKAFVFYRRAAVKSIDGRKVR